MPSQKKIELTKNDIVTVIHTGGAEQSALSASFIEKVKRELGIVFIACYMNSYEKMVIPEKNPRRLLFPFFDSKAKKQLLPEHPEFEHALWLMVYINESYKNCRSLMTDITKKV